MGVPFDVLIDNVEQYLAEGQRDLDESRQDKANLLTDFFTAYHTYDEYVEYLQNLTTTYYSIAQFVPSIGQSIQGRNIFGVTIGAKYPKKKIFVSGGQHAREWVAPATTVYIINQLVTSYLTNNTVQQLLDTTQFFFVPIVNPDGYVYSWGGSSQRLWRKNRRLNSGGSYGVDLNRNWDDHWGGQGSSPQPTSDTYHGTGPFSEPETLSLSKFITANGPFDGAIDYHCYSQLILRPYGWTKTPPPNENAAKLVGDAIRARILAVNGVSYTSESSWELYYTTGSAQDWYYSEANIPLSYTIELRDTGRYGFQLPANQIKPTGSENWAGFLYFAQAATA